MAAASPLNHPLGIPTPDLADEAWRPSPYGVLLAALLVAALFLGGLGLSGTLERRAAAQAAAEPAPTLVLPTRELAPEWRWRPPPVDVDRMFRRAR